MSEWISVQDQLPEDGRVVLAVKQLRRSGRGHHSRGGRSYCLAYCIRNYRHYDPDTRQTVVAPYWVCRGTNNNVICWMPVPEMPKEEENDRKNCPGCHPGARSGSAAGGPVNPVSE